MRKTITFEPDSETVGELIQSLGRIATEVGEDARIRSLTFDQECRHVGYGIDPFVTTDLRITVEAPSA